jgi:hypothetical protein
LEDAEEIVVVSFPNADADRREEVADATRELLALRDGWLNPPAPNSQGDRPRTLTKLYNDRPSWLTHAHERLDEAVHAAYGWRHPLDRRDVLARLVALNLARSIEQPLPEPATLRYRARSPLLESASGAAPHVR